MTYTLTIKFDGAMVLGPPPPNGNEQTICGPLFAVMPLGRRRRTRYAQLNQTHDPDDEYTSVHFPVIIACDKGIGRKADDQYPPPNQIESGAFAPSTTMYAWYPMRERLEFSFDMIAAPGELTYKRYPSTPECTRANTVAYDDVGAVSDMREIYPDRSTLRKKMLRRRPPRIVAAQVFVPYGEVSAGTDVEYERHGVPTCYRPKRTYDEVHKCALKQVRVTVEVEHSFEIRMFSLDTGLELEGLSFAVNKSMEILIGNGDPKGIRERLEKKPYPKVEVTNDPCDTPSPDFELLYDVLAGYDDGGGLPIPYYPSKFLVRPCYTAFVNGG